MRVLPSAALVSDARFHRGCLPTGPTPATERKESESEGRDKKPPTGLGHCQRLAGDHSVEGHFRAAKLLRREPLVSGLWPIPLPRRHAYNKG